MSYYFEIWLYFDQEDFLIESWMSSLYIYNI